MGSEKKSDLVFVHMNSRCSQDIRGEMDRICGQFTLQMMKGTWAAGVHSEVIGKDLRLKPQVEVNYWEMKRRGPKIVS